MEIVASFTEISEAVNPVTDTFEPSCLNVRLAEIGDDPDVWEIVITGAAKVGFLSKVMRAGTSSLTVPDVDSILAPTVIISFAFNPFNTVAKAPDE